MFTTPPRAAGAALLSLALLGAGATAAHAQTQAQGGRPEVHAAGHCSSATVWKLKAKTDDGRIDTEYEVDANRTGQVWTVAINDNGVRVFTGRRTTRAPSGSFSVDRRLVNRAGGDRIVAVARNLRTGERCVGSLTFTG